MATEAQKIAKLAQLAGLDAVLAVLEGANATQKQAELDGVEFKAKGGKKAMAMTEDEDMAEDDEDMGMDEEEEGEADEPKKKLPPFLMKKKKEADSTTPDGAADEDEEEEGETSKEDENYILVGDMEPQEFADLVSGIFAGVMTKQTATTTKEVSALSETFKEFIQAQATAFTTLEKQLRITRKELTSSKEELAAIKEHLAELTGFQAKGVSRKESGNKTYRASQAGDNVLLDEKTLAAFKQQSNGSAQQGDEYSKVAAQAAEAIFGPVIAGQ